jgi:hypothetical protein
VLVRAILLIAMAFSPDTLEAEQGPYALLVLERNSHSGTCMAASITQLDRRQETA